MSELLTTKLEVLEKQHERERAGIRYICKLVVDLETKLRGVFLPDAPGLPDDKVPEYLYERAEKGLQWISYSELDGDIETINMTRDQFKLCTEPLVLLKWASYLPISPDHENKSDLEGITYIHRPTKTGIDLVEGLRKAQGYVTLSEQKRINRGKNRW